MIKATIQNSPYCTEIRFPCSETELSKKLEEIKINPEYLAPVATVIGIEPAELSMLEDCDVSLDALNFLGKRMDGMSKGERNQFLAVLSCPEIGDGWGLKNIINLTYNLERFTLIEDTDDLERVGRTQILNVRGYLSESESNDHEWLVEEGMKLLESGSGIDTEYGKLYINEDVPFAEIFDGTTFPTYYCEPNSIAGIEIGYGDLMELVELPCEDITIKKALCRLGTDSLKDCKITVDSTRDITDEWSEKISDVEKTKDLFGLNNQLKTEDIRIMNKPESLFHKELARKLSEDGYIFSFENDEFSVTLNTGESVRIQDDDFLYTNSAFSDKGREEFFKLSSVVRGVYECCDIFENAEPLKTQGLRDNYRQLSEFNGVVLAAKHTEYGFEFVTWLRSEDGKHVCNGNYFSDVDKAKENFAIRAELVDKDRLFGVKELERLGNCVEFTMQNCGDLNFDDCEHLKKLNEKISESLPEQPNSDPEPKMSM